MSELLIPTQSQLSHVPDHFYRKATLKNSERFGSQELAQIEGQLLEARDQSSQLEYDLFMRIREEVAKYMPRLQSLAGALASVDVLQSLAFVAESQLWVKPTFNQTGQIHVLEGRHPVVEAVLGRQSYVPNSLIMAPEDRIQLITGPNMSGKSTYMRQIAIMVILAQLGSYVPAKEADLPIFDAIFTRIGAADDLVSGQSTFMVEMMEANQAVQHASPQSLILFSTPLCYIFCIALIFHQLNCVYLFQYLNRIFHIYIMPFDAMRPFSRVFDLYNL